MGFFIIKYTQTCQGLLDSAVLEKRSVLCYLDVDEVFI